MSKFWQTFLKVLYKHGAKVLPKQFVYYYLNIIKCFKLREFIFLFANNGSSWAKGATPVLSFLFDYN